jgi:integrase
VARTVSDVNGEIVVDDPKTEDSGRSIPIPAYLVALLRPIVLTAGGKDHYVFSNYRGGEIRPNRFYRSYQAVLTRAGLAHHTIHDLRHTSASILRALGCPKDIRAALLGHDDADMVEHYAGRDVEPLRPWVEKLAAVYLGEMDVKQGRRAV